MTGAGKLELWGGIECTVARIGDVVRDQCVETGHRSRLSDLDRIAELGIKTIRYPIVWETVIPNDPESPDWTWHDKRLAKLRDLGIRVIATLCHHGSGPRYTSLLDASFASLLADYAGAVARRYPWLELYTPVNEPLTTARFSALYGHWYPHLTDYGAFLRALVAECEATALAMGAIRQVRPNAQLIQTEDLGKSFSTPRLGYQADHENERRWLTFDLLCGSVDRHHPLWDFLTVWGRVPDGKLGRIRDAGAAPDIIGINHYLTSDRYLDERMECYPEHHRGSNGHDGYADVEAVRVDLPGELVGPTARLIEAWQRYGRPLAVTEVHHGCTRDEQLRWFMEVWNAGLAAQAAGADVRAVTVWALLGTVDWNSLLTRSNGIYEPGAFDVRGPAPRSTALAQAARSLAQHGSYDHPVLDGPGWWRRNRRFYFAPTEPTQERSPELRRRVVIAGGLGILGQAFARVCDHRGIDYILTGKDALNILASDNAQAKPMWHPPWAVIDAGTLNHGSDGDLTECLAQACDRLAIPFVAFSSDLVFDGRLGRPYLESDPTNPFSAQGRSQARAESAVLSACARALVIRTGDLFGPWDGDNFVHHLCEALCAYGTVTVGHEIISPTYVPDLVHVVLDLLVDGERGIWHLANPGAISLQEFAQSLAERARIKPTLVIENGPSANRALASERGSLLPPLETTVERFLRDCDPLWQRAPAMAIAAE